MRASEDSLKQHFCLTSEEKEIDGWGYHRFPDGQIQFWGPESLREITITHNANNGESIMLLLQMIEFFLSNSTKVSLNTLYYYGSRCDKKNKQEYQVSLFLESIRRLQEHKILCPHHIPTSSQKYNIIPSILESRLKLGTYNCIIFPDESSKERLWEDLKEYTVPYVVCTKKRSPDGKFTYHKIPQLQKEGQKYLMADDLCDGGRTFISAVAENPLDVDLWVTHGIFSNGTEDLLQHFKTIYTTNSYNRNLKSENRILVENVWPTNAETEERKTKTKSYSCNN